MKEWIMQDEQEVELKLVYMEMAEQHDNWAETPWKLPVLNGQVMRPPTLEDYDRMASHDR